MLNTVFCKEFLKWFVVKVGALVTDHRFRHSESRKVVFFKELEYHHMII